MPDLENLLDNVNLIKDGEGLDGEAPNQPKPDVLNRPLKQYHALLKEWLLGNIPSGSNILQQAKDYTDEKITDLTTYVDDKFATIKDSFKDYKPNYASDTRYKGLILGDEMGSFFCKDSSSMNDAAGMKAKGSSNVSGKWVAHNDGDINAVNNINTGDGNTLSITAGGIFELTATFISDMDNSIDFTTSFWIKMPTTPGDGSYINFRGAFRYYVSGGYASLLPSPNGRSPYQIGPDHNYFSKNGWILVTAVYLGASKTMQLYLGGVLWMTGHTDEDVGGTLFKCEVKDSGEFQVRDLKFYNRALTPYDVARLYNNFNSN